MVEDIELQDQRGDPFAIDDDSFDTSNNDLEAFPGGSQDGGHRRIPSNDHDYFVKESLRSRLTRYSRSRIVRGGLLAVLFAAVVLAIIEATSGDEGSRDTHRVPAREGVAWKEVASAIKLSSGITSVAVSGDETLRNLSMAEQMAGFYYPMDYDAEFIGDDSSYMSHDSGAWTVKKVGDSVYSKTLFDTATYNGKNVAVSPVSVDSKMERALVYSDKTSQFRHSTHARYWILDLKTAKLTPVHKDEDGNVPKMSYAATSPKFNYVSFVLSNDLYVRDLTQDSVISVTQDGSENIFNGRPDWVTEEEVLGEANAVYWSADESKMAYLRFDDTAVQEYPLEFFHEWQYPQIENLKYPKTGTPNPSVSIHVYNVLRGSSEDVKREDSQLGDDFIVYDMAWVGAQLVIKETDRTSREINWRVYDSADRSSKVVRSVSTKDYSGWHYGGTGKMYALPDGKGYFDLAVVDMHTKLAYFNGSTAEEPSVVFGQGEDWEAMSGALAYNSETKEVFFQGTAGSAVQRFIYSGSLENGKVRGLTNTTGIESWSASFSKSGKHAHLKYHGPGIPYSRLIDVERYQKEDLYRRNMKDRHISDTIATSMAKYSLPRKVYQKMTLDDNVTVEMIEVRPANFDSSKRYPLLLSVYGGPGLQKVNCDFNFGFEEVVVSALDAIVLYVDPRGTGGRDWTFKGYARDRIGYWEPRDIAQVARNYVSRGYIDSERTCIWGWSYGGFTTLKTLEFDSGRVFKYGMAVAPVTDWMLYDSIYTERYMGSPDDNKENYEKTSQVGNVQNFEGVDRFLIMHGTGDDNVHLQNTLQLVNKFDMAGVENYDLMVFPDSDHNIAYNNARTMVMDRLFGWLEEKWE